MRTPSSLVIIQEEGFPSWILGSGLINMTQSMPWQKRKKTMNSMNNISRKKKKKMVLVMKDGRRGGGHALEEDLHHLIGEQTPVHEHVVERKGGGGRSTSHGHHAHAHAHAHAAHLQRSQQKTFWNGTGKVGI